MTASIRDLIAAAVGLTEPAAAAAFTDTLTADRDTYGDDHVTTRLQAAHAAVLAAFPAAGITATTDDLEHAARAVYYGLGGYHEDLGQVIPLVAQAIAQDVASPPYPRTRSVRGADLRDGDVLWLGDTRNRQTSAHWSDGPWHIDGFEPYKGVLVDNGTFPPDTRIAFLTRRGDRLEMTVHPATPYPVLVDPREVR